MGIVSRKEREKEEMRQSILDAALRLFREKGYDGVSIRNIAEAIEYSPATIYLYYKDKSEIFFALQYEAAALKRDHVMPAAQIENPWERLIDFGRRYIDFGMKHPDLYDLLFITRSPMESIENQECWQLGIATHAFLWRRYKPVWMRATSKAPTRKRLPTRSGATHTAWCRCLCASECGCTRKRSEKNWQRSLSRWW